MADAMTLAAHLVLNPDYKHGDELAWWQLRPASLIQVAFEGVEFPPKMKMVVAHSPFHYHYHLRRDAMRKAEYRSDQE